MHQPVTLFGETDSQRCSRLRLDISNVANSPSDDRRRNCGRVGGRLDFPRAGPQEGRERRRVSSCISRLQSLGGGGQGRRRLKGRGWRGLPEAQAQIVCMHAVFMLRALWIDVCCAVVVCPPVAGTRVTTGPVGYLPAAGGVGPRLVLLLLYTTRCVVMFLHTPSCCSRMEKSSEPCQSAWTSRRTFRLLRWQPQSPGPS